MHRNDNITSKMEDIINTIHKPVGNVLYLQEYKLRKLKSYRQ